MLPTIKILFERWRWNAEYELYVSSEGRVRDRYKQPVEAFINQSGYSRVYSEAKCHGTSLHRLVLETWRPRKDSDTLTVEHCDNNKRNNSVRNLMWMPESENQRRAKEKLIADEIKPKSALSNKQIRANGVLMTIEDAATFVYALPGTAGMFNKKQIENKIRETLYSNKAKKQVFGITLEEVEA